MRVWVSVMLLTTIVAMLCYVTKVDSILLRAQSRKGPPRLLGSPGPTPAPIPPPNAQDQPLRPNGRPPRQIHGRPRTESPHPRRPNQSTLRTPRPGSPGFGSGPGPRRPRSPGGRSVGFAG
ncbi:hypothetical protein Y032_0035g3014 [Ancylostoma ceylanicum]|nr:hypothetical protein Y032_0035g3014 [Ancylostoma ceylanicum]